MNTQDNNGVLTKIDFDVDKLGQGFDAFFNNIPYVSTINPLVMAFIHAGLIILATVMIQYVAKKTVKKVHKRFAKRSDYFDATLTASIKKPLFAYIWIAGFTFAVQVLNTKLQVRFLNLAEQIRDITFVLCVTWSVIRFIDRYRTKYLIKKEKIGKKADLTTVDAIVKVLKAITFITAIIVLMDKIGISVKGILAFGGVSGIAVGFAAKDLLSNFFGAIMIYMDKPFVVGDWIRSPDREIEGMVESIGWRQTKIITFEQHPIYIPNSVFSSIIVENKARMKSRRIKESVCLRYCDIGKVEKIVKEIKNMLLKHEGINKKLTILVSLDEFGDYSLNILVYAFANTIEWEKYQEIKQDVLLKISKIIDRNGTYMEYPTSNIILNKR